MIIFRLMLLIYRSTLLALGQIWANKMRSILTALGIIIGVASVTAVIAAMTGMKTYVLEEFETFGTKKIFAIPHWPEEGRHAHASWRVIRFLPEQFDGWETTCPSIESLSRVRGIGGNLRYGDQAVEAATVTGIEPDWHAIENRVVTQGRTFSDTDQREAHQVCIISPQVRDRLQLDRDCTGQSILINNRRFKVIGLLEPSVQSGMFGDSSSDAEVFIPFSTAWRISDGWMHVVATCKTADIAQDARAELRMLLRRSRSLRPDDPDTFRIEVMQQFIEQFENVASVMTLVAAGIVAISLLVGGIGIMNIMLVSVSERTREIGLRKAVGARPSAVLLQFLVEAAVLCFVGGLIGLALGQGFTMGLKLLSDSLSHSYIPILAIVLALGFSGVVGIVFGMFPAIKAALLDPIEALRHE